MKKTIRFLFAIAILFITIPKLEAASYTATASATTVTIGSNVSITVKGTDAIGLFKVTSSNIGILKPTVSSADIWVEPSGVLSFSAVAAGTVTITITPSDVSSGSGSDITKSLGTKTITIKVNPKATAPQTVTPKSSINYLTDLSVDGTTISPKFDKQVGEYTIELDSNITSINIKATKQDTKSSVTGAGNITVTEGINILKIVVTAENGSKRTYTIRATVKEKDPIEVQIGDEIYNVIRNKESLIPASSFYTETTVKINDEDIPAYYGEITEYILVGLKDSEGNVQLYIYDENNNYKLYKEYTFGGLVIYPLQVDTKDIPNEFIKSEIEINGTTLECYIHKKSSNIILIYGINIETKTTGFYKYDVIEHTLQYYDDELLNIKNEEILIYQKIVIGLLGVIVILLLASSFQGTLKKEKKPKTEKPKKVKKEKIKTKEKVQKKQPEENKIDQSFL